MVLKNKRKALIITGIVLAAVLVATLIGILIFQAAVRSDVIKSDKWRMRAWNKNIEYYRSNVRPIETSDDLWAALLEGGVDLSELSPASAEWGYHYWYDVKKGELVLATYKELSGEHAPDAVLAAEAEDFAPDSPRSVADGYYLTDTGGDENNGIGVFLESLTTVSTADGYRKTLESMQRSAVDADKKLVTALTERMESTALVNESGIFTNADSASRITHVYIPENTTGGEFIVTGIPRHVRAEIDLSALSVSRIRIPRNVKVAEYCFEDFHESVEIHAEAENGNALGDIFSAESVRGKIVISTGEVFTLEGDALKNESGYFVFVDIDGVRQAMLLSYRRPVTDFEIKSPEAMNKGEGAVYINASKSELMPNGTLYAAYDLPSFTLSAQSFVGKVASEEIVWEEVSDENGLISVDEKTGRVTVDRLPDIGPEENYTAVVRATAKAGGHSETIVIYVVRPLSVRLNFGAKLQELENGQTMTATFDYTKKDTVKSFSVDGINYNTNGMVVCGDSAVYTCEAPNDDYFSLHESGTVEVRKVLDGQTLTRSVSVRIGCITISCEITVVDCSYAPIKVKLKNGNYIYRVGNANALTLGHFFQRNEEETLESGKTLYVDVLSPDGVSLLGDGEFSAELVAADGAVITSDNWQTAELRFKGTGFCMVELRDSEHLFAHIMLEIVDGRNITAWTTGKATENLVLQSDVVVPAKNYMLNLGKYTLYGNGFLIDAKSVTKNRPKDDPSTKKVDSQIIEDLISMSSGTLDGVILVGPTYPKIHNSSDDNNVYWVHGVNVAKHGTIKNSYIYGFRSPIRLESGSLDMSDTVVDGGALSNMFIKYATELNFHNVTTIQGEYTKGAVGCGLLFTYYKGSSVLNVTGEFKQYNFAMRSQLSKLGGAEAGMLLSDKIADMKQFRHGSYYHTGVLVLGRGKKIGSFGNAYVDYSNMPSVQHNLDSLGYTTDYSTSEILVYVKAQLIALNSSNCGTCTHPLKPDDLTGDGKYDYLDFRFGLGHVSVASNS